MLIFCMWLQVINEVKVTHKGKGHIKVKVKISTSLPILCNVFCPCICLKGLHDTNKVEKSCQGQCEGQGEMKLKITS